MSEVVQMNAGDNYRLGLKSQVVVWLIYSSDGFKLHMERELGKCTNLSVEFISLSQFNFQTIKDRAEPDLIFIQAGGDWSQKLTELYANSLVLQNSNSSLVVFGDETNNLDLKIALRIGASDFVAESIFLEGIASILTSVSDEKLANRDLADLLVFVNSKGGSGASTVSLNTAIELAKNKENKVLYLDLDVQFGAIQDYLDLKPQYGLHDIIDGSNELDEVSLQTLVTTHFSGLSFLNFQQMHPIENELKARSLHTVIPSLREHYSHVVADLSRGIEANYSSLILQATKVYFIAQQSYVSIKNTNDMLGVVELEFGLSRDQVEVVVNRYDKKQHLKITDIEEALGQIRVHVMPNDYKIVNESSNLGKPFSLSKKKSPVSEAIERLASSISKNEEETKSWFGKIFS
ncbi:Flp pilus assembly protein [Vibrio inusitatus NBRC 102082]|uniref:Flp pilus assembly protein n=1 Tax=Vibrio inusitatus NBRC 102082 TaxID=1219070 RepID=A0A4Y3HVN9_9VIBR|nr:AAA family ATPase [Vibrio inusitatus]GEA51107.1 Flp pilus assembly protein [Vibrio inusitatus NBRC 102082]